MRRLIILSAAAALSGCVSQVDAPISSTFGQAVASMDSQIIDPTPAEGIPASSAVKAAGAVGRYENDRVTQPLSSYGVRTAGSKEDNPGSGTPPTQGDKAPQ